MNSSETPSKTSMLDFIKSTPDAQFVIPVYQRNYTWTASDQVKQYMDDFESVLSGEYKNHFLGIIIYLEKKIDFKTREFSVIDGQQRITTTFLLLYAIKKQFETVGDGEDAEDVEKLYLIKKTSSGQIRYKLKPLVSDDDAYKCIIEDRLEDIENKDSNVLKNYNYIVNRLNEMLEKGYDIYAFFEAMDQLYAVWVPLSEDDDAQKIFESINATGEKLTASDLIRNYLLMDLDSDTQENFYEIYWRNLEKNISRDSKVLEMFFRMYIAVKTYNLVAKNSVYKEFVKWTRDNDVDTERLFKELVAYSRVFCFLLNKDIKELPVSLRRPVSEFRKLRSDIPLSLVLETCKIYKEGIMSEDTFCKLVSSVNSYMVRRSICDMNSKNISRLFPSTLKKIKSECDDAGSYDNAVDILNQEIVGNTANSSGSYMPNDKQMYDCLKDASVYKRPALRMILERMELDNNPAPVDLSSLSIEHLMPQTPTDEWLQELDTDTETYEQNLNRLGNLTLAAVHDNSVMSNELWDFKNEVLKGTGHLTLNMPLLKIKHWDLTQIDKRTDEMISRICELYPYPNVQAVKDINDNMVDQKSAAKEVRDLLERENGPLDEIKKDAVYTSSDMKIGYLLTFSKVYRQGNSDKYWFSYRPARFDDLKECRDKYQIMVCRGSKTLAIELSKDFLEEYKSQCNISTNEDGSIAHYHIVIFDHGEGKITMLLSHPQLREIDISDHVVID